jgi:hypothetical protein
MGRVARPTFSFPRRYGLLCETQILLLEAIGLALRDPNLIYFEAIWLALRDLNFSCRGEMACATGSSFTLPVRDGNTSEMMRLVGPLFLSCRGDKACSARHQFVFRVEAVYPTRPKLP